MKPYFLLAIVIGLTACSSHEQKNYPSPTRIVENDFDEAKEKAAIMKVIESESVCFFKRDYDCWKNYFVQSDYAFHAWNNFDGSFDARSGWKEVDEKIKSYIIVPGSKQEKQKSMGQEPGVKEIPSSHPKVIRKNLVLKNFSPVFVFLMWDQYNSEPDEQRFNYSKETRIMEKVNGEWKIANVTSYWDFRRVIKVSDMVP